MPLIGNVMGRCFCGATVRWVGYVGVSRSAVGMGGRCSVDLAVGGNLANVFVVGASVGVLECVDRCIRCI